MGTTAQDVEKSIEVAILDPTHSNEAIALEKLQAFVSKKPDEVPGLEARLQALYHGKVAPLSTFIEFLFVIRQHLSPETVNKVWWELVLKPALKREPLTTSTTRHAIEIALIGLQTTANSHAFRLRLLSLYIHGVPNPASTEEALDTAAMNKVERSQLVRWKAALIDILLSDCVSHPTEFFEEMAREFNTCDNRLPLSILLSQCAAQTQFPIVEFGDSKMLESLLLSLHIDHSASVFTICLSTMTMLLPHFAITRPDKLKEILPQLLAILARAICWQPRSSQQEDTSDLVSKPLHLREDKEWNYLEHTFEETASSTPDATRYFTFLYGVYPCNSIEFLRSPIQYMADLNSKSPFTVGWEDVLDEDDIRTRSKSLLRGHVIHPAVVFQTSQKELDFPPSWQTDVPGLVGLFSQLDTRNIISSGPRETKQRPNSGSLDIWTEGSLLSQETDQESSVHTPQLKRATVSISQIVDTHIALKSGAPVDIMDDLNDFPSTPRVHVSQVPAFEIAAGSLSESLKRYETARGTLSPEVLSLTSTQRDEARDEAISSLQRDMLMVMNELNFEVFLRRQHLAQLRSLHTEGVHSRHSEMERQRMRDQIKLNESEIDRHKREKNELQDQLSRYREGGDRWEKNLRKTINNLKQEKTAWESEAKELRARDRERKDVLTALSERLAQTELRIFQLENEKKANATKVALIADFEMQIEKMNKAQEIWQADHRKLKFQSEYIEQATSKLMTLQSIIDSQEHVNGRLVEKNSYLVERVDRLTNELEQVRLTAVSSANAKHYRSSLDRQNALQAKTVSLEAEVSKLRATITQLSEQLEQEEAKRENFQMRERLRLAAGNISSVPAVNATEVEA